MPLNDFLIDGLSETSGAIGSSSLSQFIDEPMAQPQKQEQPPTRSIFAEPATALLAGVTDLAEQWSRAYRLGDIPQTPQEEEKLDYIGQFTNWLIVNKEKFEKSHPYIYAPVKDESEARRILREGVRAVIPSVASGLPGAAVGGAIGGGPVGVVAGYALSGGTIFGLAEYDQFIQEVIEHNKKNPNNQIPPEIYKDVAIKSAILEGGLETAGDAIQGISFGFGKLATKPVKDTIASIMKQGFKGGAKNFLLAQAKATPAEVATEMLQNAGETALRQSIGLETPQSPIDAAINAIGPTILSTILIGAGAHTLDVRKRGVILNVLQNPTAQFDERFDAMKVIYDELLKSDKVNNTDLATKWGTVAQYKLLNNEAIDIDQSLSEMAPLKDLLRIREGGRQVEEDVKKFKERSKPKTEQPQVDIERPAPEADKKVRQTMGLETRGLIKQSFLAKGFSEERSEELSSLVMGSRAPETTQVSTEPSGILDIFGKPILKRTTQGTTRDAEELSPGSLLIKNLPGNLKDQLVLTSKGSPFSSIGAVKAILKKQGKDKDFIPLMIGEKEYVGAPKQLGDMTQVLTQAQRLSQPQIVQPITPTKREPAPEQPTVAKVPVMLTKRMEADLTKLGYTGEQINKLTPVEAHKILTEAKPSKPITTKGKLLVKLEGMKYAGKNIQGVAGQVEEGEKPQQAEAVEVPGEVTPPAGRVVQEPPAAEVTKGQVSDLAAPEPIKVKELVKAKEVPAKEPPTGPVLGEDKPELRKLAEPLLNPKKAGVTISLLVNKVKQGKAKKEDVHHNINNEVYAVIHKEVADGKITEAEALVKMDQAGKIVTKLNAALAKVEEPKKEEAKPVIKKETKKVTAEKEEVTEVKKRQKKVTAKTVAEEGENSRWFKSRPEDLKKQENHPLFKEKLFTSPRAVKENIDLYTKKNPDTGQRLLIKMNPDTAPRALSAMANYALHFNDGTVDMVMVTKYVDQLVTALDKGNMHQFFESQAEEDLYADDVKAAKEYVDKVVDVIATQSKDLALQNEKDIRETVPKKTKEIVSDEVGAVSNMPLVLTEDKKRQIVDYYTVTKKADLTELVDKFKQDLIDQGIPESLIEQTIVKTLSDAKIPIDDLALDSLLTRQFKDEQMREDLSDIWFDRLLKEHPEWTDEQLDTEAEKRVNEQLGPPRFQRLPQFNRADIEVKLKVGQKVTLEAFEDQPEEKGKILKIEKNGMLIIQLDPEYYKMDQEDDGIRELDQDQIKLNFQRTQGQRTQGQRTGQTVTQVKAAVEPIIKSWSNAPKVNYIGSRSELPASVKRVIASGPQGSRIGGVFYNNEVYLIGDELNNSDEVERALLHEVVGHYGISNILGEKLTDVLDVVYGDLKTKPLMFTLEQAYGLNPKNRDDRIEAAAEYVARLAQENQNIPVWEKITTAIRDFLRDLGFTIKLTDADIRALLADAKRFLANSEVSFAAAPDIQFQSKYAAPFYSQLTQKVQENLNKLPKASISLKNWLAKNAKPTELKWMGVDQYLKDHPIVDKQHFLDFLKQNEIQVTEIIKGKEIEELAPRDMGYQVGYDFDIDTSIEGVVTATIMYQNENGNREVIESKNFTGPNAEDEATTWGNDRPLDLPPRNLQGGRRNETQQFYYDVQEKELGLFEVRVIDPISNEAATVATFDTYEEAEEHGTSEANRYNAQNLPAQIIHWEAGEEAPPIPAANVVHSYDIEENPAMIVDRWHATIFDQNGDEVDTELFPTQAIAENWAIQRAAALDEEAASQPPETSVRYNRSPLVLPGGEKYREILLQWNPPAIGRKPLLAAVWVAEGVYLLADEKGVSYDPRTGAIAYGVRESEISFKTQQEAETAVRELKKDLKPRAETYQSSHWDEPNILAHVRFNERVDATGKRVLFIEEIQSDWLQAAKEQGFKAEGQPDYIPEITLIRPNMWEIRIGDDALFVDHEPTQEEIQGEIDNARGNAVRTMHGPPRAPFLENWDEVMMKRVIRYAAENGFDAIAWTTGKQQADRYNLAQYVDEINVVKAARGGYDLSGFKDRKTVIPDKHLTDEKELVNFVGKNLGTKIVDYYQKHLGEKYSSWKGLDLQIGGEGMDFFYDQKLKNFTERYIKQWGGRLETISIGQPPFTEGITAEELLDQQFPANLTNEQKTWLTDYMSSYEQATTDDERTKFQKEFDKWVSIENNKFLTMQQPGFSITPQMKQDTLTKGQPWFQRTKVTTAQTPRRQEPRFTRIVDFSDITPNTPVQQTRDLFSNQMKAVLKTMAQQLPKNQPAMNVWAKHLLSPEWYDHPVLSKIVKAAIDRHDKYYELFNVFNALDKPFQGEDNIIDLNVKLRNKGLSASDILFGKTSEEYKKFEKLIDDVDTGEFQKRYNIKGAPTDEDLAGAGISADQAHLYRAHRNSYDKSLDLLLTPMNKLVQEIDRLATKNKETPKYPTFTTLDENGKPTQITLKQVISEMGQLKGTYAPRLREQGEWVIKGKRGDRVVRYHKSNRLAAELLKKELESKGYAIEPIKERERLPEDVYSTLRIVNTAKAIETAIREAEFDNPELQIKFHEALLQDVADLIRVRGFRASMVQRKPGPVIRGYITDPNERFVRYTNNIAAGIAKAESAREMFQQLAGRYIGEGKDRKKIEGIDPIKEPRAYTTATQYITEQLRNTDAGDRLIGFVKSVATFKYLGFNLRSPVVNVLALPTTVPVAIHQYALGGKGSMVRIGKELMKASVDYIKAMRNQKLDNKDEQRFMDEIKLKGYDTPQYTREALGTIQRAHSKAWSKALYSSMYIFGKSEQWIRGTTMLAAFRMMKQNNPNTPYEELKEKAHDVSNKAHGIYGKATQLAVGQGTGPGARIAQLLYTYQKFAHNYLQLLYDAGIKRGNIKAFTYGLLAPAVIGGAAVAPFKDLFFKLISGILSMLGAKWDPEKELWDWIRKQFGSDIEKVGRHGVFGAVGLDVSSSMSIGVGVPKDFFELMGVGGGVMKDYLDAKHFLEIGQPGRAAEKIIPTGFANILRASRELTGVTTSKGQRVWNEKGEPYIPTGGETALRVLGFRSAQQATMGERIWETKRAAQRYTDIRNELYEEFRDHIVSKGNAKSLQKIVDKVANYNNMVIKDKKAGKIPLITPESLKGQIRSLAIPSRSMQLELSPR